MDPYEVEGESSKTIEKEKRPPLPRAGEGLFSLQ